MKTFVLALTLSAALAGAHAAELNTATAAAQQAFRGTYDLEDGRSLSVSQRGRKLYAQVDGGAPEELIAAGDCNFTTMSGDTRLQFQQAPNGSVAGVRLIRTTN